MPTSMTAYYFFGCLLQLLGCDTNIEAIGSAIFPDTIL